MHADSDGMESCIILWPKFTMTVKCTQVVVMLAVGLNFFTGWKSLSKEATAIAVEFIILKHLNRFVGLNERMPLVCTPSTPVDRLFYAIGLSSHHGCNQRFVQNWILKIIRKDKSLVNSSDQL